MKLEWILWLIAATFDGTFPNHRCCHLHNTITNNLNRLCYENLSLFAESRCIYFFSDSPKTARKPLCNSGFCTSHIFWGTMINISSGNDITPLQWGPWYITDRSLKLLPDLTNQHVYLNCYSKVTVKFAVPVLNETTAKIPKTFGTTETSEAAKYCQM